MDLDKFTDEEFKFIHDTILRSARVVPKAFDASGEKFNSDCHLEVTDETFELISKRFNVNLEMGKHIVNKYLYR